MRAAIDDAGRLVIPKRLRDELGLTPGPVEVVRDGAAVRIEPVTDSGLDRVGDRLVIPASGEMLDDAEVRELRLSDQQ
jgi:AbrB family looped-hinge helix DNA binding protein